MVPPYKSRSAGPLTAAQKRVALVVAVVVVLGAAAVGIWTLVEPGSYGNSTTRCVHVAIPSSTGGATIDHCGPAARSWCASEATARDAVADRARTVCREAGLLPAATTSTSAAGMISGDDEDAGGPGAPTIAGSVVAPGSGSTAGSASCRSGPPLANVYHPDRLSVVSACMTVSGTVESVRSESDGDTHFDVSLDPQFSHLLRPANLSAQHGWLVAEIVPADKPGCTPGRPPRPPSGTYDYGICTGADELTPSTGQHLFVTGPYVLDEDHGGWAEIHPVWAVSTVAPATAGAAPPPTTAAAPPTTGPAAPPTQSPAPPPTAAASGVRITSVTSPVKRGDTAALSAQTSPNAACNLEVTLPSGARSESQGLGPATADSAGSVHWTWRTGTRTKPGTATATVTCGSSLATAQFQITS